MRSCVFLVTLFAACDVPAPPPSVLPSLRGGVVIAASDRGAPAVVDRMSAWAHPDPDCVADAYGGIELVADVAPDAGDETVLTSFSQGVFVIGHDGHRIAATAGFGCTGSQDELVAVEILRTSLDHPVIAVAITKGGRRERSTWLELLEVGSAGRLNRLFRGEIERHGDRGSQAGGVTLVPGGLVYRHPTKGTSLWRFDGSVGRYVAWRASARRGVEGTGHGSATDAGDAGDAEKARDGRQI
jgi:hypothetical protein